MILAADPSRHAVLPHMQPAAWDVMFTLMGQMAQAYPESMRLSRIRDDVWRWENDARDVGQSFTYGDASTLPEEPLSYICGQIQEDVVLLDQRNDQLFADAGVVTFAADWSFGFDVGMSFLEIHGPVPRIRQEGVITRAHEFSSGCSRTRPTAEPTGPSRSVGASTPPPRRTPSGGLTAT